MPWIAATAFLHSVMIQERRGTFKVWNMVLVIMTFSLVIVGTFLTRAGLVSSVHSFAQSDIGPYFLAFTALILLGSFGLVWLRLPDLRTEDPGTALLSRESAFMANNLLFMGALFGVFWGTLFPLFSEIADRPARHGRSALLQPRGITDIRIARGADGRRSADRLASG